MECEKFYISDMGLSGQVMISSSVYEGLALRRECRKRSSLAQNLYYYLSYNTLTENLARPREFPKVEGWVRIPFLLSTSIVVSEIVRVCWMLSNLPRIPHIWREACACQNVV